MEDPKWGHCGSGGIFPCPVVTDNEALPATPNLVTDSNWYNIGNVTSDRRKWKFGGGGTNGIGG
jgi:hypothetical protein